MDDTCLSIPCGSPTSGLLDAAHPCVTPTRRQQKWISEENEELMYCYYSAQLAGRGYRCSLKSLWDDRNLSKTYRSENNFCCQHSSQPVAFARSEINCNMQTKLSSTPPFQLDGENKHNIHKMCP